jgi:hypothetical protein
LNQINELRNYEKIMRNSSGLFGDEHVHPLVSDLFADRNLLIANEYLESVVLIAKKCTQNLTNVDKPVVRKPSLQ